MSAFKDIYVIAICLLAFALPLPQLYVNIAVAVFIVGSLIDFYRKRDFVSPLNSILILPIAFYVLHLIGLTYTDDLKAGFNNIQTKLSFLIFPLLLSKSTPINHVLKKVKFFFIAGCVAVCIYDIVTAIIQYRLTKNMDVFYYISFSKTMHVQYFTIYLNMAIIFLIDGIFNSDDFRFKNQKAFYLILIVFFILNITLLASRLATVVSYITVLLYFMLKIKASGKFLKYSLYGLLLILLIVFFDYFSLKNVNRFEQVERFLHENENYFDFTKKEYNSTTLRIPLWINAYQVIESNPLTGVGTGDSRAELDSVFLKNKFQYAYQNHFDPHNQYLQTGVILGLAGLTLLLTMFLVPLYYSIRYRHYQFICLLIIFMFNMLTESIFERQAGIMFFSFFYSLFSIQIIEEMKKQQLPATE